MLFARVRRCLELGVAYPALYVLFCSSVSVKRRWARFRVQLTYSPALTPEPDFDSEIFRDTREIFVQALHLTEAEATGRIRQQWLNQQAVLTARWNEQELADEEERQHTQLEQNQALAAEKEAQEEAHRELEKKKPKFPQVARGTPLQIRTTDRIPEAARAKLRKLEYVPLYPVT